MKTTDRLAQYGVSSTLAEKAEGKGLTSSKIRALSKKDLTSRFGLAMEEVHELKTCVARRPIEADTLHTLLERSNHTCCVCKGVKGGAIVVHHIQQYELSQDNSYYNLAVLCPNDHDRAHQRGALSMGLSADRLTAQSRPGSMRWR